MKSLPDIQQLINDRAEKRLKDDLEAMRKTIINMPILSPTQSPFPMLKFGESQHYAKWFFNDGVGTFYEAVYNYWLPIYKNREAQNFLADVERLKSDVNDLMNVTHENDY